MPWDALLLFGICTLGIVWVGTRSAMHGAQQLRALSARARAVAKAVDLTGAPFQELGGVTVRGQLGLREAWVRADPERTRVGVLVDPNLHPALRLEPRARSPGRGGYGGAEDAFTRIIRAEGPLAELLALLTRPLREALEEVDRDVVLGPIVALRDKDVVLELGVDFDAELLEEAAQRLQVVLQALPDAPAEVQAALLERASDAEEPDRVRADALLQLMTRWPEAEETAEARRRCLDSGRAPLVALARVDPSAPSGRLSLSEAPDEAGALSETAGEGALSRPEGPERAPGGALSDPDR